MNGEARNDINNINSIYWYILNINLIANLNFFPSSARIFGIKIKTYPKALIPVKSMPVISKCTSCVPS